MKHYCMKNGSEGCKSEQFCWVVAHLMRYRMKMNKLNGAVAALDAFYGSKICIA